MCIFSIALGKVFDNHPFLITVGVPSFSLKLGEEKFNNCAKSEAKVANTELYQKTYRVYIHDLGEKSSDILTLHMHCLS